MSVGYSTIVAIKSVEAQAKKLGFDLAASRFHSMNSDSIDLIPSSDALPIYSRDATIMSGHLHEIRAFLRGIEWAREYDDLIKVSNTKKRKQGEDKEMARREAIRIKQEQKKMWNVLRNIKEDDEVPF